MMMKAFVPLVLLAAAPAPAWAADPITGRWLTKGGEGIVAIERCGQQMCGRLARVIKATPGAPTTDANNPNKALRNRPLIGTPILTGFKDAGKEWRGTIYDPKSGRSYRSTARIAAGKLKVRGCIAMFCQTQEWTRLR